MIEIVGRADLLDQAGIHDHHAVGQGHRLDLIMGHVDRRRADFLVHLLDLGAHLHAQLGVEIGQRLVEQEHLGIAHDGAPHGDTLALAAGELLGLAVEQLGDVEDLRRMLDALVDLRLWRLLQLQAERHVLVDVHVRIERVVLEHHGDVPVLGRHVVDDVAADRDVATRDLLEAGDHAERRALAAAGRPDQHDELLVGDVEIDAADGENFVVLLDNLTQRYLSHVSTIPLSRPRSDPQCSSP